ncbi:MAG: type IV pilus modification PilV family protein [Clostridium sp.]|uniref:type IV pilus modification PilV family protein n=1 Tax=Clostridium sp. TaxID=1506 RepID=UPI003EE77C06
MRKNLKRKNGWKCKGYTLIEVMIAMSISLSMILIIGKGIIEIEKLTGVIYEDNLKENLVKTIKINLHEYLTRSNNMFYNVENGKLQIYIKSGDKELKDEIYSNGKELSIKYFRDGGDYEKTICHNIKKFEIIKKKRIVYLNIQVGDEEFYVCL